MAWLRRHKIVFVILGVLIGFTIILWAFVNKPVSINLMQPGDWKDTHIQSIGTITIQKLAKGAPYTDIRDIEHISGIGPAKMAQIKRHFTTWDTAKADLWFPLFLIGLVLFFVSVFVWHIIISEKHRKAKNLEKRLFEEKDEKR